jgi:uncharacterized protein YyaL (SSP411 family)
MTSDPPPASGRKPNRLASEQSPYLRQHAYNPVDWYPWGEEALGKARELDRPIFLSVGYSSCHWCHVMERESFEREDIARIMNEHFINVKVDREERPDIDSVYMSAVQQMTGSGGWPMSVFLTPDLKPFFGGTYFPPDARFGRIGFPDLLLRIAEIYRTRRDDVEKTADTLTQHLGDDPTSAGGDLPGEEALAAATAYAKRTFDPMHGGFGPAPKFPRSIEIMNLLRAHARTGDEEALRMAEKTLDAMAAGGMNDQIGGGFHRYSTDERWLVPHFEKMLYDNALLARAYLEAYLLTGKRSHAETCERTLDYVLREMTSPDGGFYSATDADSEGEEGRFFVWSPGEIEAIVGKEDSRILCERFGITLGGNFEHGKSIAHAAKSDEDVARALGLDVSRVRDAVARGREALYRARESREKPFRDDKILASWNGLMISALARAAQALERKDYEDAARRAALLVLEKLRPEGRLHRVWKDGVARVPGYLDDHAYMAEALVDLWETTFEPSWLEEGKVLGDRIIEGFLDPAGGGLFYSASWHEELIVRKKDPFDNATPSAAGVAALTFLRLAHLTGDERWRGASEGILRSVGALVERAPMVFGYTLLALDFRLHPPVEIAITGDLASIHARDLLRTARRRLLPNRVVAAAPAPVSAEALRAAPLLEGKEPVDGRSAAYVCRDFSCKAPVTDPRELEALLAVA